MHNVLFDQQQLAEMTAEFAGAICSGLQDDQQRNKCLPTYLNPDLLGYKGEVYVVDLGGSNLRAARVKLTHSGAELSSDLVEKTMQWQRGVSFDKEQYLTSIADIIAQIKLNKPIPLAYCFSYPCTNLYNGDATLNKWTKGIYVPDTEGKSVTQALLSLLKDKHNIEVTGVQIVNDTVASLLAGLTDNSSDGFMGLIAGTGFNAAAWMPQSAVAKLPSSINLGYIPINFECGNHAPSYLSRYDEILDKQSETPGEQLLEKAAGSMYLSRLFNLIYPDNQIDQGSGAKGLSKLVESEGIQTERAQTAIALYQRASQLTAMAIVGTLIVLSRNSHISQLKVVCEGGMFWSEITTGKAFVDLTQHYIHQLTNHFRLSTKVKLDRVNHANIIGSALALYR